MTIPLFDLSDRNALVTGGSKGRGLAMAKATHEPLPAPHSPLPGPGG
jgi:hypothetical protein